MVETWYPVTDCNSTTIPDSKSIRYCFDKIFEILVGFMIITLRLEDV
jgi:hypothetical protein